jgi:hypothetical protein
MSRSKELFLSLTTAAAGAVMLLTPARVSRALAGRGTAPPPAAIRLLGGRYAVQAAAQLLLPRRSTFAVGATVDALHAASMIPVAAAVARYRLAAVSSLLLATASVAANSALAGAVAR